MTIQKYAINDPSIEHALPCGCSWERTVEDFTGPIYWNPFNGVVQCHKCGQQFVPLWGNPTDEKRA